MPIKSDAQRKAVAKFNNARYEQILLRVDKGKKALIAAHAEKSGKDFGSVNGFINRAIEETIARDQEEVAHE